MAPGLDPDGHMADVGIDVGAHRIAWGWPSWQMAAALDFGRSPAQSRDQVLRGMQRFLAQHLPVGARLWVDQPFAGNGGIAAAQRLSETIGAVLTAQPWIHPPVIVHQSTWKAQVIGNVAASKDTISEWLREHHPELWARCHTEDERDAMVIGLYGKGRREGIYRPPDVKRPKKRVKLHER